MVGEPNILHPEEIARVLEYLDARRKTPNGFLNLTIFRLSVCCGLRRKEILGLNLGDLILTGGFPAIHVRSEITKASRRDSKRRGRHGPLYWDRGTLDDITAWAEFRKSPVFADISVNSPVVCCVAKSAKFGAIVGGRLGAATLSQRWRRLIKCLGPDRQRQTTLHSGRHSFVSNALYGGRPMVEVARAVGHRSVETTNLYAHLIENPDTPDLFEYESGYISPPRPREHKDGTDYKQRPKRGHRDVEHGNGRGAGTRSSVGPS